VTESVGEDGFDIDSGGPLAIEVNGPLFFGAEAFAFGAEAFAGLASCWDQMLGPVTWDSGFRLLSEAAE
jgi:hypothetical protein